MPIFIEAGNIQFAVDNSVPSCVWRRTNQINISGNTHMCYVNFLKPTGFVHQQFNIQQLYALSTLYLCVLYLSENKQRLVPLTA